MSQDLSKKKGKWAYAVICAVYSASTAAKLQANGGKVFLSIAKASGKRQFDWQSKKSFSLERHELYVIKEAMQKAVFEGVVAAQEFCAGVLGPKSRQATFVHQHNGSISQAGVVFQQPSEKYPNIMAFSFSHGYGDSKESIVCAIPKSYALQMIRDLDIYFRESLAPVFRREAEIAMGRGGEDQEDIPHAHGDQHSKSEPEDDYDLVEPF